MPVYVWVRATTSYPTAPRQSTIAGIRADAIALTLIEEDYGALQFSGGVGPGHVQVVEHDAGGHGDGDSSSAGRRGLRGGGRKR